MFTMSVKDFILTMAVALLAAGVITFIGGVITILVRGLGKETKMIADQTTKLAQKGLSDDVAGLVGNASVLIDSLSEFVKTSAGLGIFLVLVGILLLAAAFGLIMQLQ
jgi:hypothetical protein